MNTLVCVPVSSQSRSPAPPAPGTRVIIALDVARATWVYCVRWDGQEQRRLSTPGTLAHLQALVQEYAACSVRVVYEACGFGYEIAWWAQAAGHQVHVIAPSRIERAPGRRVKTDRVDARTLAAKAEQGGLKTIYVPPRALHEHRQVLRTYVQVRQDRRRQQTRVRSLLQEHGRLGPPPRAGWAAYTRWLTTQELAAPLAQGVAALLTLRREADHTLRALKATLLGYAALPAYAALVTALRAQAGIGPFGALWLVLELGDMRRFATGAALVHYLGLVPAEHSSGPSVRRGHILKCGPGTLRALLVECAWRSLRPHGDPGLQSTYQRLRPRLQAKRAIIAVTRQLALRVHARWMAVLTAAAPTA